MNKKLSSAEKKDMYKQIDHLSKENLYLLAENDPIINEEENTRGRRKDEIHKNEFLPKDFAKI